jgi:hypothetical protein
MSSQGGFQSAHDTAYVLLCQHRPGWRVRLSRQTVIYRISQRDIARVAPSRGRVDVERLAKVLTMVPGLAVTLRDNRTRPHRIL